MGGVKFFLFLKREQPWHSFNHNSVIKKQDKTSGRLKLRARKSVGTNDLKNEKLEKLK